MIADRIMSDQQAGLAILSVIGNAPHQGFAERGDGFRRFAALWRLHGGMMAAIHPMLGATSAWPDPVAAASELQREVEMLADDLAAREAREDERWRPDFLRLRTAFDQLCRIEQLELLPLILALPPDRQARLAAVVPDRGRAMEA